MVPSTPDKEYSDCISHLPMMSVLGIESVFLEQSVPGEDRGKMDEKYKLILDCKETGKIGERRVAEMRCEENF